MFPSTQFYNLAAASRPSAVRVGAASGTMRGRDFKTQRAGCRGSPGGPETRRSAPPFLRTGLALGRSALRQGRGIPRLVSGSRSAAVDDS